MFITSNISVSLRPLRGEEIRLTTLRGSDFHEFLRHRRSVRRFLPDPVPEPVVHRILETATWSPSAHNRQPWRFVVLHSPESRSRLAKAMAVPFRKALIAEGIEPTAADEQVARSRDRLEGAPTAILLCLNSGELDSYQDARRDTGERMMGVQSVALAGGSLLLAAHAEGLGAVWVCAPLFVPEEVRFALDLPGEWEPQALILLGLPKMIPKPRDRRPIEEVTRFL